MPEGFRVDLAALQDAADGVGGTLDEVARHKVSDIDCDPSAVGHDRLGATVADFCDRWSRGVDNLAEDGRQVAGRLTDCVNAYQAMDQEAQEHLDGLLQRSTGEDPAAQ